MRPWLQTLPAKLGLLAKQRGRSIVVLPADRPAVEAASELLAELRRRYPRLNFVFVTGSPALRVWLSARFPGDRVVPFPWSLGFLLGWFRVRLKVQLMLVLGRMSPPAERLLAHALAHATAGAIVGLDGSTCLEGRRGSRDQALHPDHPCAAGVPATGRGGTADRLAVLGSLESASVPVIADRLVPLIAQEPPERTSRSLQLLASLARTCLIAAAEGRFFARPLGRRFEVFHTLRELGASLGHPRTIVCLGNGPSSEDPRLADLPFDCLFRVNYHWCDRGFLAEPDAVFTGMMRTIRTIRRPVIFCLHNRRVEERLILHGLLTLRRLRFASIERLGVIDAARFGAHLPTNGAMMLATAVALRPARLIVAGIDLFQDARGAYPGDPTTPNAYTSSHDRDVELKFMLDTLSGYDGELVIVSPVLDQAWRAHIAGRQPAPAIAPLRA